MSQTFVVLLYNSENSFFAPPHTNISCVVFIATAMHIYINYPKKKEFGIVQLTGLTIHGYIGKIHRILKPKGCTQPISLSQGRMGHLM